MSYSLLKIRDIDQRNLLYILSAESMLDETIEHPHPLIGKASAETLAQCNAYFEVAEQQDHFQEQMQSSRKRLGHYIEDLLVYWLAFIAKRSYHSSIQINDHGRSLGEFDLLFVKDNRWHWWELCFKFYCLSINEDQKQAWIGPNSKDTCARKYEHLFHKQLMLADHAAAQTYLASIGADRHQSAAWFKGYLFIHPQHRHSKLQRPINPRQKCHWYLFEHELEYIPRAASCSRYVLVRKREWIAPVMRAPNSKDPLALQQIIQELTSQPLKEGRLLIELKPDSDGWWVEINRGFIMPRSWPTLETLRDK